MTKNNLETLRAELASLRDSYKRDHEKLVAVIAQVHELPVGSVEREAAFKEYAQVQKRCIATNKAISDKSRTIKNLK